MIIVAELPFLDTDYPHLTTQQDKKTQFGADAADTGWFRFIVDQHDPWHSGEEEESEGEDGSVISILSFRHPPSGGDG